MEGIIISKDIQVGDKTYIFNGYENGQALYVCNGRTYKKDDVAREIGLWMMENPTAEEE